MIDAKMVLRLGDMMRDGLSLNNKMYTIPVVLGPDEDRHQTVRLSATFAYDEDDYEWPFYSLSINDHLAEECMYSYVSERLDDCVDALLEWIQQD